MTTLRTLLAFGGLALAGLIIYAMQVGDFWQAGRWLTTDPWGLTTLADLYLGLAISAVIIALFEASWFSLIWIIPLPFLGNVWTVIWFVYRLPEIARKIQSRA
jgi:hypothetical protein